MANTYMRIEGIDDFKGMASVADVGGKKGLFPIESLSYGFSRSIHIDVGSSGDAETGLPVLSDVSVNRSDDGASAVLQTLFFSPGAKGKTIEFVSTRTATDGKGLQPTQVITLEEARISSYSAGSGSSTVSIAYTTISVAHYFEGTGGLVEKSDTVKFNLKDGQLVSGNQAAMK
jgi:type VI secretion system secreted protein Hcp